MSGSQGPAPGKIMERLDILAKDFDAYHALFDVEPFQVINLDLNILPLDSLHKARYILPEGDPDRLVPRVLIEVDDGGAASASISGELLKKKAKTTEFQLPFSSMAASFKEGPMSCLAKNIDKRIRVLVKRRQRCFSWIEGILDGFDRHFNVLMHSGAETYNVQEEAVVSKRPQSLLERLALFLRDFDPTLSSKDLSSVKQAAQKLQIQFGTNEDAMWRELYSRYGLVEKIRALDPNLDAMLALRKWRGNELEFSKRLEAKRDGLPIPNAKELAEWLRLPSEKYPGQFFYRNNRTMQSVWIAPEGILFRRVLVTVPRVKPFSQLMIRGDAVVLVSASSHPSPTVGGPDDHSA